MDTANRNERRTYAIKYKKTNHICAICNVEFESYSHNAKFCIEHRKQADLERHRKRAKVIREAKKNIKKT